MISYNTIKQCIIQRLREGFTDARIYWDNIEKAKPPYLYCELGESVDTFDPILSERHIQLRIMVVLPTDMVGRINRSLLYNALQQLDLLLRPNVAIDDRVIFINNANTVIVDDIGHYITELSFVDALHDDEKGMTPLPLMGTVSVEFNKERKEYNA